MSSIKEVAEVHNELGLPDPEVPKKAIWKNAAVRLHNHASTLRRIQKKIKNVRELVESQAKALEVADRWFGNNEQRAQSTLDDAQQNCRTTREETKAFEVSVLKELGQAIDAGSKAINTFEENKKDRAANAPSEQPRTEPADAIANPDQRANAERNNEKTETRKKKLQDAKQFLSALELTVDQVHREADRLQKKWDKLDKAASEHQSFFNKSDDWISLTHIAKASALVGSCIKSLEEIASELAGALHEHVAQLVLEQDKPKIFVAANDALQLSAGKELGAYAKEGFRFESDKGGLLLHTKNAIEARTLEFAEITARKHLLLEAREGTELASKGPVVVGSRESVAEVIAPTIRLGSLDAATAQRKKKEGALGGKWDEAKQKPTTHLMGVAKELVTLQAGGEAPGGDKLKLDATTPAAIRLSGEKSGARSEDPEVKAPQSEGSAEVWATKKIHIEADESEGEVRINVGNFVVTITSKQASLGLAKGRGEKPSEALLTIDDQGVVKLESKGARVRLKEDGGSLAMRNGNSHFSVGKTGTKIDGAKVNIG